MRMQERRKCVVNVASGGSQPQRKQAQAGQYARRHSLLDPLLTNAWGVRPACMGCRPCMQLLLVGECMGHGAWGGGGFRDDMICIDLTE